MLSENVDLCEGALYICAAVRQHTTAFLATDRVGQHRHLEVSQTP